MKAKDLAELLLQYPEFEVQCIFCDTSKCTIDHPYPDYHSVNVCGIGDVGWSSKVVVLDIE